MWQLHGQQFYFTNAIASQFRIPNLKKKIQTIFRLRHIQFWTKTVLVSLNDLAYEHFFYGFSICSSISMMNVHLFVKLSAALFTLAFQQIEFSHHKITVHRFLCFQKNSIRYRRSQLNFVQQKTIEFAGSKRFLLFCLLNKIESFHWDTHLEIYLFTAILI